jgi:hypothetical protein
MRWPDASTQFDEAPTYFPIRKAGMIFLKSDLEERVERWGVMERAGGVA